MRSFKTLLGFCLIFCSAACSTISVNYDYDKKVNFPGYKTYEWHAIPRTVEMNDLLINRVKNAANRVLQSKGFREVSENPDFLIAIHTSKQQKVEIIDWGYAYGPYWRRGYGYGGVDLRQYVEGTLILDVVDAIKNELVWRGSATGIVDPYLSPEKRTENIDAAVARILDKFPPLP
jgi:Domain of unknown function (DUF4136)